LTIQSSFLSDLYENAVLIMTKNTADSTTFKAIFLLQLYKKKYRNFATFLLPIKMKSKTNYTGKKQFHAFYDFKFAIFLLK